jgi:membrane protease subunit HflC
MKKSQFGLVIVGVAIVAIMMSIFYVDEREVAVKFRFGEIVASDYEPGLHFKIPVVNNVRYFPKQIRTINNLLRAIRNTTRSSTQKRKLP